MGEGLFRHRRGERGNVFAMLFGAVALTGVLAAVSMQTLQGPVTTITRVTQRNVAETQMLMNARIIINAAIATGDSDADGTIEPAAFVAAGGGETPPTNGGYLPLNLGLSLTDPWGGKYGYCIWDHGTDNSSAQRITGDNTVTAPQQPVIAVIAAGPDKIFQTSCPTYAGSVMNIAKGGDDLVQKFTYAEASQNSNGLWNLKAGDDTKAELKDSGGTARVTIDRATGIGDFLGITVDTIAAKTSALLTLSGGLKLDTETNVTACTGTEAGSMRYNAGSARLEFCNGTAWKPAGGAPDATFITQTPSADLSAEQALSALATGIMKVTTGTGVVSSGAVDLSGAEATGTLAAERFPALTGEVTTTAGSLATTVADDVLDFSEFKDAMTLDASTDIAATGTNVLSITNTGTGNSLLVNDDTSDTTPFVIDAAGNVGIGTAGPTQKVHVSGGNIYADNTGAAASFIANRTDGKAVSLAAGTNGSGVRFDNTGSFKIQSQATSEIISGGNTGIIAIMTIDGAAPIDTLYINSGGNVGIGTAGPGARLDVAGAIKLGSQAACDAGGANNGTVRYDTATKKFQLCVDGVWGSISSIAKLDDIGDVDAAAPNNNEVVAWDTASGTWKAKNVNVLGNAIATPGGANTQVQFNDSGTLAGAAQMVWDKTNNRLGIGAVAPASNLHVKGASGGYHAQLEGTTAGGNVWLKAGNTTRSYLIGIRGDEADNFVIYDNVGNADRLVIDSTGKVGIGTINPSDLLHVAGNLRVSGAYPVFRMQNTSGASGSQSWQIQNNDGLYFGTTPDDFSGGWQNSTVLHLGRSGNVGVGGIANASALLDVTSTAKGFLPPRMTTAQRDAISSPAAGLTVYNTTTGALNVWNGTAWTSQSTAEIAFEARGAVTSLAPSGWTDVVMPTQVRDSGGDNYDPATGRFTAPEAGTYFFAASIYSTLFVPSTRAAVIIQIAQAGASATPICMGISPSSSGGYAGTGTCSGTVYLNAGQVVEIIGLNETGSAAALSGNFNTFSGFKIGSGSGGGGSSQWVTTGSDIYYNTGGAAIGQASAPDASAALEVESTAKGFLPPRMTTAQRNAISSPATGLVVYDADLNSLYIRTASAWSAVGSGGGTQVAFSVRKTASQGVPANGWAKVTWDAEDFDTNNNFDLTTERFTPTVAGKYQVNLTVYSQDVAGYIHAVIYKNGAFYGGNVGSGTTPNRGTTYSTVIDMNGTTDYIEAYALPYGSGTVNIFGAGTDWTRFSGFLIGGGGGSGTPGGNTKEMQFNDGGAFAGAGKLIWDKTAESLAIGTTSSAAASSILDLTSTAKGFLPPRMTTAQRDAIASPAEGLVVYNTTTKSLDLRQAGGWLTFGGSQTGNTMISGWPDAILCTTTTPNFGASFFYINISPGGDGRTYYRVTSNTVGDYYIGFNTDGTHYAAGSSAVTTNCNTSISALYAAGRAFNLAGGGSVGTSVAFLVNKNGAAQTVANSSWTKVTWGNEVFDTNNNFASDRFTPSVAGKYLVTFNAYCSDATSGYCAPAIYKNGTIVAEGYNRSVGVDLATPVTAIVDMNGTTDYLEAFIAVSSTVTPTLNGLVHLTYFSGFLIGGGGGGGSGTPSGNTKEVQFNDGGAFAGAGKLIWDKTAESLAIGTTSSAAASSLLDLTSTAKGFLPPRMTTAQRNAISSPATGLVVYDTDLNSLYIKTASAWSAVGSGNSEISFLANNATTSTPTATWTTGLFAQVADNGGDNYNPATGVFTAPVAGTYHFSANMYFGPGIAAMIGVQIVGPSYNACTQIQPTAGSYPIASCSGDLTLSAGQTVYAQGYHTSGSTVAMAGVLTNFSGFKISGGSAGGGSGTPGGANTQVQFNNSGAFGGDAGLTWDNAGKKLVVSANAATPQTATAGTVLHIAQADTATARLLVDTYGSANGVVSLRKAKGTAAAPSALQSADYIGGVNVNGYGSTAYSTERAGVWFQADQTWTDANQGTSISFWTTPNNATTEAERMRIDNTGAVSIGSAAAANASSILDLTSTAKGFLPPRMTTGQRDAISSPAEGLVVYNTTTKSLDLRLASSWLSFGGSMTGNTMVTGWPDAIQCYGATGKIILYHDYFPSAGNHTYISGHTSSAATENLRVVFTSAGVWSAVGNTGYWGGYYETNCNGAGNTIATLYAAGNAFNFVGGATASAAGAAGQVQFYEGGNLQADAGLTWDNTNKRLGLGTASPAARLVAYDSTAGAGATALRLYNNTGTYSETGLGIYANAQGGSPDAIIGRIYGKYDGAGFGNQRLTFQVADAAGTNQDVLSLKSGGNVGIGTASPQATLHVKSATPSSAVHPYRSGLIVEDEGTNVGGRVAVRVASDVEVPRIVAYRSRGTLAAPAAVQAEDTLFDIAPIPYDGTGYSGWGAYLAMKASENWTASAHGSDIRLYTIPNGGTVATEALRVGNGGNVGIGTTGPQSLLHVAGTGYAQFEKTFAGAPTAGDCDAAAELGRVTYDSTNSRFYFCAGAGGWKYANVGTSGGTATAAGNTGEVQFNNAGSLAADSGLFWDNTNKRLGIGTTGPATPLDIHSVSTVGSSAYGGGTNFLRLFAKAGSTFSEPSIAFQETSTDVGAKISAKNRANGAYDIIFANRDTSSTTSTMYERMRIDSSGNVGIGTAGPGMKLDVQRTGTETSGGRYYTSRSYVNVAPASASSAVQTAHYNHCDVTGSAAISGDVLCAYTGLGFSNSSSLANAYGQYIDVNNSGSGTLTNGYGTISQATISGSGNFTDMRGVQGSSILMGTGDATAARGGYFFVSTNNAGAAVTTAIGIQADIAQVSGTITNGYGVYIGDVQATNDYGIYQVGANDDNYFAGNVGIGTAGTAKLHISADGTATTAMSNGGTLAINSTSPQINFNDSDNNDWAIHANGNRLYFIREPWVTTDLVLDGAGNVGIGTAGPQSLLHVANTGYAQFEKTFAGAPTAGDCDAAAEAGRITIDTTNDRFYFCDGAGWLYAGSGGGGSASGVAGAVQFSGGSGAFASDETNLFWDNTNKRLGIGTASPAAKLTVGTALTGTAHSTNFMTNAGTLGTTAGSELLLASLGYVPTGNQAALGVRAYRTANGSTWADTSLGLEMDVDNVTRAGASLWLHANGNVGVGVAAPTQKLDVAGNIKTSGVLYASGATSTYGSLTIDGSKNGWSGINFKQAGANVKTLMIHSSYSGVFNTADNAWDWMWTGGTLTNGTIPAANVSPAPVTGAANVNFDYGMCTYGAIYGGSLAAYGRGSGLYASGGVVYLDWNTVGLCATLTTNYITSDSRLKTEFGNLPSTAGLSAVMKLRPVTYRWKDKARDAVEGEQIGFIAQEVEKVLPMLVRTSKGNQVIETAKGKETVENAKTLNYRSMIVPLVKAVQELKGLFDDLAKKVAELLDIVAGLKTEIAALKADNDNLRAVTEALKADNDNLRAIVEQQGEAIKALQAGSH